MKEKSTIYRAARFFDFDLPVRFFSEYYRTPHLGQSTSKVQKFRE